LAIDLKVNFHLAELQHLLVKEKTRAVIDETDQACGIENLN
jgi:hypothetical protein